MGLNILFNPIFEADYSQDAARPQDGDGNGVAGFDIGALEFSEDVTPPQVAFLEPGENTFLRQTVTVTAQATDNDSVASMTLRVGTQMLAASISPSPPAPSVTAVALWDTTTVGDGSQTLTATATDLVGNNASATRSVIVDNSPPDTQITSGPQGEIGETTATFIFTGTDNPTPVGSLQFSWRLGAGPWSAFSSNTTATFTGLSEGPRIFEVKARDLAGNEDSTPASREFSVVSVPVITAFSPQSGTFGREVTIEGRGFDPASGKTFVRFNGVQAAITSVTQTSIRAGVPNGATTGRITVETSKGITSSSEDFIVLLRQDFSLSVNPEVGVTVPGTSATYATRISSIGPEPFTGLASLSVSGLPAGVTVSLTPQFLASSATALLTLTTSSFIAVGSYPIEVRATAPIEGHSITRTAQVTLAVQAAGKTVLIGQVRDEHEGPLAGVSIKQGGATITPIGSTDAGGNFFIPLSVAGPQVFLIDGSTANTSSVNYSTIPVTLDIQAGVVNTLGFTPKLHAQPVAKLVPIIPGQETVLTDPEIPGFKMTIPAGVQIIGWDGKPNTQFSVTAIPIDRSPLPPPPPGLNGRQIYLFNFGKVGGGVPTGNIPIDTPNNVGGLPGDQMELYYFNEAPDGTAPNRWEKYGTGTISSDGTQVVTDINPVTGLPYGIPRFCCGAVVVVRPPPPGPEPGGGPSGGASDAGNKAGEPVDTATGFFYMEKTDLGLPGIIPVAITRTYRTQLTNAGPFGLGTSWPYDIFLQPPPDGSPDALILFTPGNRQDLFARQPDGRFTNSTSPASRGAIVTTNGVSSLRFKDGSLWQFDAGGRLISQADRNGNVVTLTRDSQGRVTQITEPSGRQVALSYAGTNIRINSIQDPLGREIRYGYDGSGRLTTVTDAAGGTTQYTYDGANRMVSITDPRGIIFLTNEYDAAGRVIRQTQADGGIWTFAYTTTGSFISQTTVTDPRGNSTTYRFNTAGYLISQTDALGQTTTFERQGGTNLLLSTGDALGRVTRFTYDASGNVTSITDPAGNVRRFQYEPTFNKLTKIIDLPGQITSFEYDATGNFTATVDPIGARTAIVYNVFGQPVTTTDPLGNVTTFTYDFGNLATIADPLGNRTQRAYDLVSRLIEQTDPRGRSTRFTYDGLNRITQIIDGLNGVTSFGYDGNGNLLTVTDARGNTITHTYDSMDRLATRADQVGAIESFVYDGVGNLTRHTDRKGQVSTFSYDVLNRRTGGSYADGATTSFVYDAAGRLTEATDSVGGTILNAYDSLDRLIAQTTQLGTISYQYDVLGRRTRMDVTGQAPVTYSYDPVSRLTQVGQGTQLVDLTYDTLGRRTRLTLPNGVSTEYQYDAASRLTALIYSNAFGTLGDLTYQYDPAGNRTSVGGSFARTLLPDPVASASSSYDPANRQLQFGNKTSTYDANGNLTLITDTSGLTTFTWDARNRLISLVGPSATASFNYNALGDRISKSVNGDTTSFQLDGVDILKEIQGSSEIHYLRSLAIDEPLVQTDATASRYQLRDGLNSTVAVVDTSGSVAAQYSYDPFGQTVVSGGTSSNPFQFTGRENDGIGIYYYRARYYSPSLMRFLSEDPIGLLADSVNFYAYVFNNPVNLTDPSGKVVPIAVLVAIGAGIGGTANALSYFLTTPSECREVGKLVAAFGVGALAGGAGTLAGAGFATVAISAGGLGVFSSNVVGGIANGLVSQGVQDIIHGQASAPLTYIFSAGANALGGGLAARIPGLRLGGAHPGVDATSPVPRIDFIPWRYGRYFGPNSARVLAQEAFANTAAGGLQTGMQALSGSVQCKK